MSNTGLHRDGEPAHNSLYENSSGNGYFEHRDRPRGTSLKDSVTAEDQTKAKEASQSQPENVSPKSASQHSQEPRQSPTWADQAATHMLDTGSAPPEYFAATADRNHQRRHSSIIGQTDNIEITQSHRTAQSYGSADSPDNSCALFGPENR